MHARPQEQAAAGEHAELVADDLRDVAEAELVRGQQRDRQAIYRDVHGGGEEVHQEHEDEEEHELFVRRDQRRRAGAEGEGDLHRHDPASPPAPAQRAVAVHGRRPEDLQHPRQREGIRQADPGQRHVLLAQEHGQGRRLEAEGQALNEIEQREPRKLRYAPHRRTLAPCDRRWKRLLRS